MSINNKKNKEKATLEINEQNELKKQQDRLKDEYD